MKLSVLEAKDRLPELIAAAQAGEEVVISGQREAAVRLVPVVTASEEEHPVGSAARILAGLQKPKPPGWKQKTPEEIDAIIKDIRESWD
jgi:antitoxin (DNA-binding transcriptional repressor) of toxin-antitoxin stability system